jgi:hypothetical protein
MCHITSTQLRDYFFPIKVFSSLSPCWFFIRGGEWRKPPRKVSYKHTFGAPDQGQMLDVWESQTTESALRWQTCHITPRHILELTLEGILEHVLGAANHCPWYIIAVPCQGWRTGTCLHFFQDACDDVAERSLGCGVAHQQQPWSPISEILWAHWNLL